MIEMHRYGKASRSDGGGGGNTVCGDQLSGGGQIETKGASKGGCEAMERGRKPGGISWTGIARQPLFPGETPMRAGRGSRRSQAVWSPAEARAGERFPNKRFGFGMVSNNERVKRAREMTLLLGACAHIFQRWPTAAVCRGV